MFRYESQNRPWISKTSSCRHFVISLHRNIFPELIFCYSTSFRGVSKDFWLCQLILKERLDVSLPPLCSRNFRGCRSVRGCLDVGWVEKAHFEAFVPENASHASKVNFSRPKALIAKDLGLAFDYSHSTTPLHTNSREGRTMIFIYRSFKIPIIFNSDDRYLCARQSAPTEVSEWERDWII